ncbi:MAG: PAS-domain containing protein [Xanthobacteraceae bacterium]
MSHLVSLNDWPTAAVACLACFLAGLGAAVLFRVALGGGRGDRGRLLDLALNNMTQGVVMFDRVGRLAVCNKRYLEIYRLSPDVIKPGARLTDIVRHRFKMGGLHRDPEQYCAELLNLIKSGTTQSFVAEFEDGRSIATVNRPIPGGAYWIGTHHDITERRKAERRNTLFDQEEARRAVVEEAIAWFRESVEAVLRTVADSVAAMRSTAKLLATTSNETTAQAEGTVRASNEAFGRVDTASVAAEELSRSIAEINRQLLRATEVVRAAAGEAQSTNAEIAELAQAAQKIDDVVKLIQTVAGQINLLALNATIEAARAGTAGKGFAVVASEVKALSVQTAKATEVIAAQIAAVQSSTQSTVRAIASITDRMQEIQQFTAAIATAVEEQHSATNEISNNVAAAAAGTKTVVSDLHHVASAITNMHNSVETVLGASAAVERAADSLRSSVDGFLHKVAV